MSSACSRVVVEPKQRLLTKCVSSEACGCGCVQILVILVHNSEPSNQPTMFSFGKLQTAGPLVALATKAGSLNLTQTETNKKPHLLAVFVAQHLSSEIQQNTTASPACNCLAVKLDQVMQHSKAVEQPNSKPLYT